MSNAEMVQMANLIKKYMETEWPKQLEEAAATGDYLKSSSLSQARQSAFNLLQSINQ